MKFSISRGVLHKKCIGCIMIDHECVLYNGFEDYIEDCPCIKCLVKITCTFSDVCYDYNRYMANLPFQTIS